MRIGIKVGDIMTRELASVRPEAPLTECAEEMAKKNVGLLIVKNNGNLKGILSERDILWSLARQNKSFRKARASDAMKKQGVVTISPAEDIYTALVRMKNKKIKWLPVTVKDRVIGMLTIHDILHIEPSLFEIVSQNVPVREETEKLKRKRAVSTEGIWTKQGECEECGAYGLLTGRNGMLLCEDCQNKNF